MAEGGRTGATPTTAHVPPAENSPTTDSGVGHGSSNAPGNLQPAKKTKGKKNADSNDTGKLLAAKINQLEIDAAGEKDQEAEIEREVKKANRDLTNLLSGVKSDSSKLEVVQKKFSELVADMKRVDRDLIKSKKKADQLQKEKDSSRSELTKSTSLKDKLEKLSRELSKENKKLKVFDNNLLCRPQTSVRVLINDRRTIAQSKSVKMVGETFSATRSRRSCTTWKTSSMKKKIRWATSILWRPTSCKLSALWAEFVIDRNRFRHKFKSFVEQYDLREHQFMTYCRNKELEVQWHAARYELQRQAAESEKMRANNLSNQVTTFSQTEAELRGQLNIYVEKFKQVPSTFSEVCHPSGLYFSSYPLPNHCDPQSALKFALSIIHLALSLNSFLTKLCSNCSGRGHPQQQ